jgi:hypothetical protein
MAAPGSIYTDSDAIHIEGNPDIVNGSKRVKRDLSTLISYYGLKPICEIAPVPRDKHGKLMRMCNQGHYAAVEDFGNRNGKKDYVCLKCRKIQRLNHTFLRSW